MFPARSPKSAPAPPTAPEASAVTLVAAPGRTELVDAAVRTWRAALVDQAGGSARSDIELLADAALDLSAAHPSGMAQLLTGRPTRLSNLIREGAALSGARRRARAVAHRAAGATARYGVAPTSLAIGVATWVEQPDDDAAGDGVAALADATAGPALRPGTPAAEPELPSAARTVRVPVLLRPVGLAPRGSGESDYELTLEPIVEVNPVLARALRSRGALLDPDALASATFADGGFDPRPALNRLASLGEAVLPGFELVDRRVVGAFVHPGQTLVDDLDAMAGLLDRHEVVAALAGDADAAAQLAVELPAATPGDRDLSTERGVGDLDDAARHVVDVVAGGAHVLVDAPLGSDSATAVAALLADAAHRGRTALYVPGSRRATAAVRAALDAQGLGDLMLEAPVEAGGRLAVTRRLLGAMTLAPPPVDAAADAALREHVATARDRLAGYVAALHAPREPWGVSAYDALQRLAELTARRPAPATTARLTPDAARVVDDARMADLGADLRRAGELGAFTLRPGDTAWFGADLHTTAEAQVAVRRVERLLGGSLAGLVTRSVQVAAETGLVPAASLDAWAEQLQMLDEVRSSLDVFSPEVFERSPATLVAATASKAWRAEHGVEQGFWQRRRLRKQARDLVRPGRPVPDLHVALREVHARREVWRAHCPAGGWPRLPDGFEQIEDEFAAVRRDVEALQAVLPHESTRLAALPLAALTARLQRLAADAGSLDGLPERTTLLAKVNAAGLERLVADLRRRRVAPAVAPAELHLAWWSTVLEAILTDDPALAGYDGAALGELLADWTQADRSLVAGRGAVVLRDVVTALQARLRANRDQDEALFVELVEESIGSLRDAVLRYPDARHLRPVLAAGPMVVPAVLPPSRQVDLVVLDAAGHLPTEVVVPALARGRQVVVVGDVRCAVGTAVRELAALLPSVALRSDTSRRDPYLTRLLAEHGYRDVLVPVPLPDSAPLVGLHLVDGTGMPDASGVVESTREEVACVVDLVLDHALSRPEESMAVVAVSERHADAVRDAVLGEVRDNPALAAFFDAARPEPFVVTDLTGVAGLTRDAVLLSLGLGRTPHGRVLHTFGAISAPGGDALLLQALGVSRHRLDVVSCFASADLDPTRVRGEGPALLADLLAFAQRRAEGADDVDLATVGDAVGAPTAGADPLLLDVAERLWKHGLDVELDHGLPGGLRIPLVVGHPALPGRFLVAVLTDDEAYSAEPSVRTRDRLRADRLRSLGWQVVRVWSAAAFLDPVAEVDRVRRAVHALLPAELTMPTTRPLAVVVPTPVDGPVPPDAPGTRPAPEAPVSEEAGPGGVTAGGLTPAVATSAVSTPTVGTSDVPTTDVPTTDVVDAVVELVPAGLTGEAVVSSTKMDGPAPRTGAEATEPPADGPGAEVGLTVPPVDAPAPQVDAVDAPVEASTPRTDVTAPGTVVSESPSHPSETEQTAVINADPPSGGPVPPSTPRAGVLDLDAQPALLPAEPRPSVRAGLRIGAYSDDQLDALAAWICSDGQQRSTEELVGELRAALALTRRGTRVDAVLRAAATRALA